MSSPPFTLSGGRRPESKWAASRLRAPFDSAALRAAPLRVSVFLLLLSFGAAADPLPPEQVSAIDASIRTALAQRPSAGLSVAVSWRGLEWSAGYGYARLSPPRPATPQTSYRLASVTKTLTGVAIMQLAENGKLALDAEVQAYLPKYPRKEWPITVRDLLTHVSGTYHYRDQKKEAHFKRRFSTVEALKIFSEWPLAHEPGTKFTYTSYGYNVLGAIVESVSGRSYGEYLRDNVFAVAGMKRSQVEDPKTRDADWAAGYRVKAGRLVPSEEIDISSRFAGGGARSTVEDLVRYGEALFAGRLVKPATWEQMIVSGKTKDGRWVDYGLGFAVFPKRGHFVVEHLGGQPETTSLLILLPAEQLVIAMLCNVEAQGPLLNRVGDAIIETLLEDGMRRRPLYADDPVDQVLLDGMNRVFSYGLARREGWGGQLPGGSVEESFATLASALSRDWIVADTNGARATLTSGHQPIKGSWVPRVGAAMARVLEEEYGTNRRYAALGPIRFFADYAEVCERRKCPGLLSPNLREELTWMLPQNEYATAKLGRWGPERALDAREVRDVLEPVVTRMQIAPDFVPELATLAAHWRDQGREADAMALIELAVKLYPSSVEAHLQLADAALLYGDEDRAEELYEGQTKEALAKRAAALEASAHPRAAAAAAWLKKLAGVKSSP